MPRPLIRNLVATATVGHAATNDPDIGFTQIEGDIFLRRLIARNPNPKGTALFLHGFPETIAVWREIARTLSSEYEVHAFDWPGYGLSSRPDIEKFSYAPSDYARVLKGYIEKTGLDRSNLTIYATDIGALPALLLALEEPDIAKNIIVGDFAPFNRPAHMWESLQNLKAEPTASPTRAYMNKTRDEILDNVHRRGLSPQEQFELPADVREDMVKSWGHGDLTSADAFAHYYSQFTRDQDYLEANLSKLQIPAKVIWGDKDIYIKKEMGIEFSEMINAKLNVLPGIGHFPHLQDPGRTVEEVRASFQ